MKRIILALLLAVASLFMSASAAPPICYPGPMDDKVESFWPYIVTDDQMNCAAVWFCDVGHKWSRVYIVGHGDNLDNCAYPYAKAVAQLFMTKAQKDAAWLARFTVNPGDPGYDETMALDLPAIALAKTVPYPMKLPPSGLVTQTTKVYKQRIIGRGTWEFKEMGSIALGFACDETKRLGDKFALEITTTAQLLAVTKLNKFDVYPAIMYGDCL